MCGDVDGLLVPCSICRVVVHGICMLNSVGVGEWTCDSCSMHVPSPLCFVCRQNVPSLIMCRSGDLFGQWFHSLCVTQSKKCSFAKEKDHITVKARKFRSDGSTCSFCDSADGEVVQCNRSGCTSGIHFYCTLLRPTAIAKMENSNGFTFNCKKHQRSKSIQQCFGKPSLVLSEVRLALKSELEAQIDRLNKPIHPFFAKPEAKKRKFEGILEKKVHPFFIKKTVPFEGQFALMGKECPVGREHIGYIFLNGSVAYFNAETSYDVQIDSSEYHEFPFLHQKRMEQTFPIEITSPFTIDQLNALNKRLGISLPRLESILKATQLQSKRSDDLPWNLKYSPESASELLCNRKQFEEMFQWAEDLKEMDREDPFFRCISIEGPPGSGKSTFASILGNFGSYQVIEMNASDKRTKQSISQKCMEVTQSKHISNEKALLLFEDLDAVHHDEPNCFQGIQDIVQTSKIPIVLVSEAIDETLADFVSFVAKIEKIENRITTAKISTVIGIEFGDVSLDDIVQFVGNRCFSLKKCLVDLEWLKRSHVDGLGVVSKEGTLCDPFFLNCVTERDPMFVFRNYFHAKTGLEDVALLSEALSCLEVCFRDCGKARNDSAFVSQSYGGDANSFQYFVSIQSTKDELASLWSDEWVVSETIACLFAKLGNVRKTLNFCIEIDEDHDLTDKLIKELSQKRIFMYRHKHELLPFMRSFCKSTGTSARSRRRHYWGKILESDTIEALEFLSVKYN